MVKLYYHPHSRASGTLWMLEEVGVDYELSYVDLRAGEQKSAEILAMNPMGKLPILEDGDAVVTESAAIALYLADRYAPGRLAPAIDDPARGTYYRWILFAPSVIEPGSTAQSSSWEQRESSVGWGNYNAMLETIEHALSGGDYLLGDRFTMADVVFGGTLRFMLMFGMLDKRPAFTAYVDRLGERPALQRANQRNAAEVAAHGLAS